jgi:flagellar basal body-associated protein FliL
LDWPECPDAARVAEGFGCTPKKEEEAMADQRDPNTEKSEMRVMWIGSIVIVLLLLGAMGINMLIAHGTSTSSTEASFQSGTLQPK